jgi:hypothetical protein
MFDAIFTEFDCFDFIESVQNEKENEVNGGFGG